jgi:acetolactate synthase I/II/III large subunit
LSALRSQYIRKMPNRDKLRLAARVGVRALTPQADND